MPPLRVDVGVGAGAVEGDGEGRGEGVGRRGGEGAGRASPLSTGCEAEGEAGGRGRSAHRREVMWKHRIELAAMVETDLVSVIMGAARAKAHGRNDGREQDGRVEKKAFQKVSAYARVHFREPNFGSTTHSTAPTKVHVRGGTRQTPRSCLRLWNSCRHCHSGHIC